MAKHLTGDTKFAAKVKILLAKVYGRSQLKDSVLERAIAFYELEQVSTRKNEKIQQEITRLSAIDNTKTRSKVSDLVHQQRESLAQLQTESEERCQHLQQICRDVIELSEGETIADTNRKSAEFLGTIQLLSPTEGSKVAPANERSKPLYKGILALRLLDQICLKNISSGAYLAQKLAEISDYNYSELRHENVEAYNQLVDQVKVPVLMAAILQDIGNNHPDAQTILCGIDGKKNPFRILSIDERKALLQINFRETINYLSNGIGVLTYTGNSKVERDVFNAKEDNKLRFTKQLIKSSVQPKEGVGNLLKVPQIYTSIVLSTKENYNYKLLPKVYQALYQTSERGGCSRNAVDIMCSITGHFPQGYGVTYIPNEDEQDVRYEYAIVTQLFPDNVNEPVCRVATRNLTFIGHGVDLVVKRSSNLYFVETAKAFSSINKERLNEILKVLSSNYLERKELDLLPRCWQPGDFFSLKANQKLWNRPR